MSADVCVSFSQVEVILHIYVAIRYFIFLSKVIFSSQLFVVQESGECDPFGKKIRILIYEAVNTCIVMYTVNNVCV